MELLEFDFIIRDQHRQELRPPLDVFGPPWIALWMAHCRRAIAMSGGQPDAAREMHRWTTEHGAFEHITTRPYWIPISPWVPPDTPNSARLNEIGHIMCEDVMVCNSLRPSQSCYMLNVLPSTGVSQFGQTASAQGWSQSRLR